jgi:hypothetical protein
MGLKSNVYQNLDKYLITCRELRIYIIYYKSLSFGVYLTIKHFLTSSRATGPIGLFITN